MLWLNKKFKLKIDMKKIIYLLCLVVMISCESEKFTAADGSTMEVSELVGMDVFDIAYLYSKSSPESLMGTNNQRWVVYYSDIDVTLETDKMSKIVKDAKKGRHPKADTWSN
jgi:hypothetical protein